VEEQDFEE
jgi:hypothetical protein